MIMTKTPLRLSFFSGGSDMPAFYQRDPAVPGMALSVTINKFVYVTAHVSHDKSYTTMFETGVQKAKHLGELNHALTRETLRHHFYDEIGVTVSSISDVPSGGTGLGSSSAFVVGLSEALLPGMFDSRDERPERLARSACAIEIDRCGHVIGKQDQYAAAYGGFNWFTFYNNGGVRRALVSDMVSPRVIRKLEAHLVLVHTGVGRLSTDVLKHQSAQMLSDRWTQDSTKRSRDMVIDAVNSLLDDNIERFGELLGDSWAEKQTVTAAAVGSSAKFFADLYGVGINAGAIGGKLMGAGGGGFFLFFVKPEKREALRSAVCDFSPTCRVHDFSFYDSGTKVIAVG